MRTANGIKTLPNPNELKRCITKEEEVRTVADRLGGTERQGRGGDKKKRIWGRKFK
jgi:hypothetical protein